MTLAGKPAPTFTLPSTSGRDVSLADLRGQRVVLYFYPRDDTPGCTREACGFRDSMARIQSAGVVVLGVSKDSLASHAKFRAKYALPFDLLSDSDNSVAKKYGAYGQKKMYGKDVLGTIRSTFLIDERGKIARAWSPVKVDGHVDQVLEELAGTPASASKPIRRATKAPAQTARSKKSTARAVPEAKKSSPRARAVAKAGSSGALTAPRKKSARPV